MIRILRKLFFITIALICFSSMLLASPPASSDNGPGIFSPEDFGPAICVGCCDEHGNQTPSHPVCGCDQPDKCGVCAGDGSSCGCELFDCEGKAFPDSDLYCRLDVNKDKKIDTQDHKQVRDYLNSRRGGGVDNPNLDFDTNDDGMITPMDLLTIVNFLNANDDGIKKVDSCGICGGKGPNVCGTCEGTPEYVAPEGPDGICGCPDAPNYLGSYNSECKICTNLGKDSCDRCPGTTDYGNASCCPNPSELDLGCGCGNPEPSGCDKVCGSTAVEDACGVCGGDGSSCIPSVPTPEDECKYYEVSTQYDPKQNSQNLNFYGLFASSRGKIKKVDKNEFKDVPVNIDRLKTCSSHEEYNTEYAENTDDTYSTFQRKSYSAENMIQGSADIPTCLKNMVKDNYDKISNLPPKKFASWGQKTVTPNAYDLCQPYNSSNFLAACYSPADIYNVDYDRCVAHDVMYALALKADTDGEITEKKGFLGTTKKDFYCYGPNDEWKDSCFDIDPKRDPVYNDDRKLYIDAACNVISKKPAASEICGAAKIIFGDDLATTYTNHTEVKTRRNQGCLPPDALVKLADGSSRRADEVFVGDLVWNPIAKRAMKVSAVIAGPETVPLIEYGNDQVNGRVSSEHPVLTSEGLKKAKDLVIGDKVIIEDGSEETISYLMAPPVRDGQTVINYLYDTDDSYENNFMVSDGVVTGNMFLQKLISKE